ncbi:MAG: hypothetical protein KBD24_02065 [Candidatus Pacebacteria bacterium]|nr:hypothetical protein [Candidatus Paceibacterota bacterium]
MSTSQPSDDVITSLGLDLLPEEERIEFLSDIGKVIFAGAIRKAWQSLDIKKQDELTALFDTSNEDPKNDDKRKAIDTFLEAYVPDFEHYVEQEVIALKNAQQDIYGELTS